MHNFVIGDGVSDIILSFPSYAPGQKAFVFEAFQGNVRVLAVGFKLCSTSCCVGNMNAWPSLSFTPSINAENIYL